MIDDKFRKIMQSNTGCAVVMAGSDSDREHIEKIIKSLTKYEVPHRIRICSAHKEPIRMMGIINVYNAVGGLVAYVAAASGTDALSGGLSYHAFGPVISCPPDPPNDSCLNNPPGSSNAYIARPENVGRFIAQMYAGVNSRFREILESEQTRKLDLL